MTVAGSENVLVASPARLRHCAAVSQLAKPRSRRGPSAGCSLTLGCVLGTLWQPDRCHRVGLECDREGRTFDKHAFPTDRRVLHSVAEHVGHAVNPRARK